MTADPDPTRGLLRWVMPMIAAALAAAAGACGTVRAPGAVPSPARDGADSEWVATWAAAQTAVPPPEARVFQDQTLRQVVHVSTGGDTVRVRLTNEFGKRPLVIGEARVALGSSASPDQITEGTGRRLTFADRASVIVPPGERVLSDPVELRVPALSELVISVYLPERTEMSTFHNTAHQLNAVAAGNVTADTKIEPTGLFGEWFLLSGVSVRGQGRRPAAIVAFGDSITDGSATRTSANHRWPDHLARRLRAAGKGHLGVVNAGISGNRLLYDAKPPTGADDETFVLRYGEAGVRRFERDVAAQPGVRYVVVLLGTNDIGQPGRVAPASEEVTAAQIIEGHRRLIAAAREHDLTVYGATITPFEDDTLGFHNPEREGTRQAVNAWIRTGGEYDGVLDFDAALRDPARPGRMLPRYDSGDGLHPNDAGMQALADAVPLSLFR